jgi:hypothetical protein
MSFISLANRVLCFPKRTSKQLWLQVHGIEGVDRLVIVGFDLTCGTIKVSPDLLVAPCTETAVCASQRGRILPSGISSSPLSVAMIAVGLDGRT